MNKKHTHNDKKLLNELFASFCLGIRSKKSIKPREWLEQKGLNPLELSIGFNSGQFHHRKSEEFKSSYVRVGVLKESNAAVRSPELKAYTCFAAYSIVFPLMNEQHEIVNLFAIRFNMDKEKTEYLNEEGIYPSYPSPLTKRLFITSTVMDAASLIQSKVMENRDSVMALFDGELKEQHLLAIGQLKQLEEIIFI